MNQIGNKFLVILCVLILLKLELSFCFKNFHSQIPKKRVGFIGLNLQRKDNIIYKTSSDENNTKLRENSKFLPYKFSHLIIPAEVLILIFSLNIPDALAKEGQYGFFETSTAGMMHPIYLLGLYGVSITAAFHGLRYRKARKLSKEIAKLQSNPNTELLPQLSTMKQKRDRIMSSNPKDKHVSLGSLILGSGTAMGIEGALSTYWRVGEIFPDPHLIGGLSMIIIWCVSYALTPFMQQGNEIARFGHVGLNMIGLLIFTLQIFNGWEIMLNVYNGVPGW